MVVHDEDIKEAISSPELAQEPDVPLPEAPQVEPPESDEPEDIELYHFIQVVKAIEKESISASELENSERDSDATPSDPVDYGHPSGNTYHYSSPPKGYIPYYDTSPYVNDYVYYAPQEQSYVTPRRRHEREPNKTPKSYEAVPDYFSPPRKDVYVPVTERNKFKPGSYLMSSERQNEKPIYVYEDLGLTTITITSRQDYQNEPANVVLLPQSLLKSPPSRPTLKLLPRLPKMTQSEWVYLRATRSSIGTLRKPR